MKSVVRTQPEGKGNDGNRRSLTRLPEAETIDSKVALIQALIPLDLQAVAEALEEEVTVLSGATVQSNRWPARPCAVGPPMRIGLPDEPKTPHHLYPRPQPTYTTRKREPQWTPLVDDCSPLCRSKVPVLYRRAGGSNLLA